MLRARLGKGRVDTEAVAEPRPKGAGAAANGCGFPVWPSDTKNAEVVHRLDSAAHRLDPCRTAEAAAASDPIDALRQAAPFLRHTAAVEMALQRALGAPIALRVRPRPAPGKIQQFHQGTQLPSGPAHTRRDRHCARHRKIQDSAPMNPIPRASAHVAGTDLAPGPAPGRPRKNTRICTNEPNFPARRPAAGHASDILMAQPARRSPATRPQRLAVLGALVSWWFHAHPETRASARK